MPRLKLTIEYAGTRYSGWQIQKNARTVQGEVDRAIREATGRHDFELYGSGRTDAGVHALAQIAHLDIATNLPLASLRRAVNDALPADINVLAVAPVPRGFHARHSAVARRYVYQVARRRTAFAKPFVWWVKEPLDVAAMQRAAAAFVGLRDFQSFTAGPIGAVGPAGPVGAADPDDPADGGDADAPAKSTLVLIDHLTIDSQGDLLVIVIQGSHFLWKMVRRIVGVLVAIGRGELTVEAAPALLAARSNVPAALTAPASGLFLERVFYPGDPLATPVTVPTPLTAFDAPAAPRPGAAPPR